jgi:hypothetical protein
VPLSESIRKVNVYLINQKLGMGVAPHASGDNTRKPNIFLVLCDFDILRKMYICSYLNIIDDNTNLDLGV